MGERSSIRVGAVSYLNTKPLIYDFDRLAPQAELVLDYPSRLADRLSDGDLDLALIPSIEFFQHPGYTIVSDACIACRGPVLSVKLFSRVPVASIRSIALDEGSRTSAALVKILLSERYGIAPRLEPLPLEATLADTSADAALLIGDRAMRSAGIACAEVWDLGDEWCRWAELPFVFAMWVARSGAKLDGIERALSAARDLGVQNLDTIARREAAPLGLSQPECVSYLRDNLHFFLGDRELRGLELFHRLAQRANLAPPGVDLGLLDCQNAR